MKEVSAQEAFELMQSQPDSIYLDVRSVVEFEAGHPVGAINVPIMHFNPVFGMMPNDDFLAVVEANVPRDATVLVGCKSGVRSQRACELMLKAGYGRPINVRGGFVGSMNSFGKIVDPGWSMLNLPVTNDCEVDASYEALASKAGK